MQNSPSEAALLFSPLPLPCPVTNIISLAGGSWLRVWPCQGGPHRDPKGRRGRARMAREVGLAPARGILWKPVAFRRFPLVLRARAGLPCHRGGSLVDVDVDGSFPSSPSREAASSWCNSQRAQGVEVVEARGVLGVVLMAVLSVRLSILGHWRLQGAGGVHPVLSGGRRGFGRQASGAHPGVLLQQGPGGCRR